MEETFFNTKFFTIDIIALSLTSFVTGMNIALAEKTKKEGRTILRGMFIGEAILSASVVAMITKKIATAFPTITIFGTVEQ